MMTLLGIIVSLILACAVVYVAILIFPIVYLLGDVILFGFLVWVFFKLFDVIFSGKKKK